MDPAFTHKLVPKHSIASEEEVSQLLKEYGINVQNLPLIRIDDAQLKRMEVKVGDVIKIERVSPVTGEVVNYYRLVVE